MKKFWISIFSILCLIAILHTFTQSYFVKQKMFSLLNEKLKASGLELTIQNIKSTYPEVELDEVSFQGHYVVLNAKKIKANISLFSLLKSKIVLTSMQIEDLTWQRKEASAKIEAHSKNQSPTNFSIELQDLKILNARISESISGTIEGSALIEKNKNTPFLLMFSANASLQDSQFSNSLPISCKGKMIENRSGGIDVEYLNVESNLANIESNFEFSSDFALQKGNIAIKTQSFEKNDTFPFSFKLFGNIELGSSKEGLEIHASSRIPHLEVNDLSFNDAHLSLSGIYKNDIWEGKLQSSVTYLNESWVASSPFQITWPMIHLLQINAKSNDGMIQSELLFRSFSDFYISGNFHFENLQKISEIAFGNAAGTFSFQGFPNGKDLDLDATIENFYWDKFFAKNVKLYSHIENVSSLQKTGTINCDISESTFGDLLLDTASIETLIGQNSQFSVLAKGKLKHPIELEAFGNYHVENQKTAISIDSLVGTFYTHPLQLLKPLIIQWGKSEFSINPFHLQFGKGSVDIVFEKNPKTLNLDLNAEHLPIDILSLNPLEIPFDGDLNISCKLQNEHENLSGSLKAEVKHLEMSHFSKTDPLDGLALLQADLNDRDLKGEFSLIIREKPLIESKFTVPIHMDLFPVKFDIDPNRKLYFRTYASGYIEDFLDFFDLGTHRIEGKCFCDLTLSHTIESPHVQGNLELVGGYYQNYFTGLELFNINAFMKGVNNRLELNQFSAEDVMKRPSVSANGMLLVDFSKNLPFDINILLNRFSFEALDLAMLDVSGQMNIQGNAAACNVSGNLVMDEGEITLPNSLPKLPPNLQVSYVNVKKPVHEQNPKPKLTYPMTLDINVHSPDSIFISGYGLDSEWKGNLHVGGNDLTPIIGGKVELVKGKFSIAGKEFILRKGKLQFPEKVNAVPIIQISGSIQVKDVEISCNILGPLDNPQFTFQSTPPLPLGSIAAYLLFGQDIAEISSLQALELAASLASFAGNSPSFLEDTKKSLGVDRIQIVTVSDPNTESGEKMALQVGKYVQEDVLVSYTQSAEYSAGDISIEISFKGGTSFVLESDQADEQRQGKFTFRWSKTY